MSLSWLTSEALRASLDLRPLPPWGMAAPSRATSAGETAGCSGDGTFAGEIADGHALWSDKNAAQRRQRPRLWRSPSSFRRARCARYAWCWRCCPHATHSRASAMVYGRRGKTTANNGRRCDPVRAGAVFPPAPRPGPQQDRRAPRRPPLGGPAGGLAPCIVVHPARRVACCAAWRDRPPHSPLHQTTVRQGGLAGA